MRLLLVIFFFSQWLFCQEDYPKDYFSTPLDAPLSISGSFGELRPNHFHSGIDFRTDGREGLPVYAAADGYISRIKVSLLGYGKVIYIDHPNGYTTVYGHLQKANAKIQELIKEVQYKNQNYEIELYPDKNAIKVSKGEIIAFSGNTGGSGGPHLHFEFRDTKTEKAINPLFFGYDRFIKDSKAPTVNSIIAYPLNDSSFVNRSNKPYTISLSLQKDGSYLADKVMASGAIGFGIHAYDTCDIAPRQNGIYKLETFLNGSLHYKYEFDSFTFEESKHINTFIDYLRYKRNKQLYQRLFIGDIYAKNIVKYALNNGYISVLNNLDLNYKIVLSDYYGNSKTIFLPISYQNNPNFVPPEDKKTPYFLNAKIDNLYEKDGISVFFPENCFYNNFYLRFDVINKQLLLHEETEAVIKNFTIRFNVSQIPKEERTKMFIATIDNGKIRYNVTKKEGDEFIIDTKKLGKYSIEKDLEAPKIFKPSFIKGQNINDKEFIDIYLSDEISGIASYNAYLNGNWILMEYESKLKRLRHNLKDCIYAQEKNDFKIIATDHLGNSTTFESTFNKTN